MQSRCHPLRVNEAVQTQSRSTHRASFPEVALFQPFKNSANDAVTPGCVETECLRAGGSGAREEFSAQQLVGAMQADFHVRVGERKNFGGFRRAHLFDIAQDDHRAIRQREAPESPLPAGSFSSLRDALASGVGEFD